MIVFDTNVVSELSKPAPAERVRLWFSKQIAVDICTTAITQAEMLLGVALIPDGKRKNALEEAVEAILKEAFASRILAFDSEAARQFALIVAARRKLGRPIGEADAQVAAIARSRNAAIATRNAADFAGCGIEVINPWTV